MISVSNLIFSSSLARCSMALQQTPMMCQVGHGFWGGKFERAYFDVRVFNPHAPTKKQQSLSSTYKKHETIKIRAYEQRVREIERGSFTPLIISLTGGSSNAADVFFKRLASMFSEKWDQPYSSTLTWMRCKLSFTLLRSSTQCIRGAHSAAGHVSRGAVPPADLMLSESTLS